MKIKTKRRRKLLPQHVAELQASGLSKATITACGFFSVKTTDRLGKILNRKVSGQLVPALAIPFRSPDGEWVDRYTRIKPDHPRSHDSRVVKYESPTGASNHAYFPPGTIETLADPSIDLIISEGEKKAAKADQDGFPCIGLVGVFGWKLRGADRLIDDLEQVPWQGRKVFIAFDSDAATNDKVRRAERRLAALLADRGAEVRVVRIPATGRGPGV